MQESKSQLKTKEIWKDRFQFHWMGLRVLVYIAEITAPLFIDALCGPIWGSVAAVANVIVWLYFLRKSRMAPGTMILWLFALAYVIVVALVEFAHLFHWQL